MYSISKQLTLLLICALTLAVFSAAIQGYRASTEISRSVYDDELRVVAHGLIPIALNWNLTTNSEDPLSINLNKTKSVNFAYQVIVNKEVVFSTENAPAKPIGKLIAGFSDVTFSSKRWRLFTLESAKNEWILVAQHRKFSSFIVEEMILAAVKPVIWVMPLLALLIYLITTRSLSPLKQLSKELRKRQSTNLSQLHINNRSTELTPVINTLNLLFSRLGSSFEREREFVSHAAHELRTPLSVMKINLHNLQNNPNDISHDLPKLQDDVERMIQAVNQLLLLSKTNPELLIQNLESVDLFASCQYVIGDLYPQIDQKQQSIELLGERLFTLSTPFMLQTLLNNLIGNAIKYCPTEGSIRVSVQREKAYLILNVEDSGPGIPPAMRDSVINRFYRSEDAINKGISGSGLGLTIVAQILATHNATLTFGDSVLGGLSVQVIFINQNNELSANFEPATK